MNTNRKTNRSRIRDFETYRHNSSSYRASSMNELCENQMKHNNQLPNSVNTSNVYPTIKEQKNQLDQDAKHKYHKANNQDNFYFSQQELKLKPSAIANSSGLRPMHNS